MELGNMTLKQAAQSALDVQNACNLSGVVFSFANAMGAICNNLRDLSTKDRNKHPIVTLYLLKLCELNGCGSTLHESYDSAEDACKRIASLSLDTTTEIGRA